MDGLQEGKVMHVLTILFFRIFVWIFFSSMTLYAGVSPEQHFAKNYENKVTKTYYHTGPLAHEVVLYSPYQPIINHIPDSPVSVAASKSDTTKERYRFFMPLTSITAQKLKEINEYGASNKYYSLIVTPTQKPMKGLDIIVEFDKQHIGFQAEIFPAITGDKAVAFKFLIRQNLEKINNKSHPIIRTAQAAVVGKKNFILL